MLRLSVVLLALFIAGCGSTPTHQSQSYEYQGEISAAERNRRNALLTHYKQWQGTPYRLGGNGRDGVDCSAFTQLTFNQRFAFQLPRTTEAQALQGEQVSRTSLVVGDLLFYKTRAKVRHVGMYVGEGQFMHASTSRGVMLSDMSNPYWKARFWQARRVIK
ncbi:C40 family peptidase [Amphritea balenae]|uniref:Glycoside hydrolase n=1 Tax=Amphritea balenae TaxID=452629 RepID=A0A3P1STC3_9GAMM|nr:NlpC/P60 family protein [Amphritea balenae]RRD00447.1 glycoside hydrolase [Amphritea balenae]GGK70738.1 lipoprotein NlpC [Amphritea balenae]